ncbi:uncharacterized protein DDB_G0292642-like [Macrobrachium nipponense]|uniref:uncharacterized protein DDB_G0292642-like n=1 Tax=Macrobrachium nipponense TaxID=159736 RepID=UPI0030C7C8FE
MATLRSEDWVQEKLDFICSTIASVDQECLKLELRQCENDDELEALFQSLLSSSEASQSLNNQMPGTDGPGLVEVTTDEEGPDFSAAENQSVSEERSDVSVAENQSESEEGSDVSVAENQSESEEGSDLSVAEIQRESENLDDDVSDIDSRSWDMMDDASSSESMEIFQILEDNEDSGGSSLHLSNNGVDDSVESDNESTESFQEDEGSSEIIEIIVETSDNDDDDDDSDFGGLDATGNNFNEEVMVLGVHSNHPERTEVNDVITEEIQPVATRQSTLKEVSMIDQAVAHENYEKDKILACRIEVINNIFSDADPDFLQEKINGCLTVGDDEKAFSSYVEKLLENKKYPTMKDYIKRMESMPEENAEEHDDEEEGNYAVGNFAIKCSICLEDIIYREMGSCNSIHNEHIYCLQCIRRYTEAEIEQGRATFRCMESGCKGEFSLKILRKIMSRAALARAYEQRQHEEVSAANIEDLESCPFCNYKAIMTNREDKVFVCMNPRCMKDSCRLCKEENHIPLRCDEVEKDIQKEARKKLENKMSEAMIRECPQCRKRFIKQQGCNNVTCSCGATVCYYCRHLTNSDHHKKSQVCQQNSNEDQIHQEEVRRAAYEGKLEIDPNIKLIHDPTQGIL